MHQLKVVKVGNKEEVNTVRDGINADIMAKDTMIR